MYFSTTSQRGRFGCETYGFSINLTTSCSSHDLTEIFLIILCGKTFVYCVT